MSAWLPEWKDGCINVYDKCMYELMIFENIAGRIYGCMDRILGCKLEERDDLMNIGYDILHLCSHIFIKSFVGWVYIHITGDMYYQISG